MRPRSGDGKRAGTTVRANAEMLRDAYMVALGRQALRNANERSSHRDANVEARYETDYPTLKVGAERRGGSQ